MAGVSTCSASFCLRGDDKGGFSVVRDFNFSVAVWVNIGSAHSVNGDGATDGARNDKQRLARGTLLGRNKLHAFRIDVC